jgi:hypothetical protein
MDLQPADVIESLSVLNGETTQAAVLNARFEDIPAAQCGSCVKLLSYRL